MGLAYVRASTAAAEGFLCRFSLLMGWRQWGSDGNTSPSPTSAAQDLAEWQFAKDNTRAV